MQYASLAYGEWTPLMRLERNGQFEACVIQFHECPENEIQSEMMPKYVDDPEEVYRQTTQRNTSAFQKSEDKRFHWALKNEDRTISKS